MKIEIPDDVIHSQNLSEDDVLLDLALGFYIDRRVTVGRGARLANLSTPAFMDELGRRKISIHYDDEDLESDLKTIDKLREKHGP